MRKTTYQAAQTVAATIVAHFNKQQEQAKLEHDEAVLAPLPLPDFVETILDTAFWASLRQEEGKPTKISIAYLPAQSSPQPLLFQKPLPLSATVLTKIAPGVERPGVHLGVWHENGALYIWGTTSVIPGFCLVVDVSEPGLLVIKHRRVDGFGKFANVAVLKGDQVKLIDEQVAKVPDCPTVLSSLLGFNSFTPSDNAFSILVQLAVSMRAHKRGGLLLVVPSSSNDWQHSMIQPILYTLQPPFAGLAEQVRLASEGNTPDKAQEAIRKEVDSLAGLTAIDGATVINDKYELLAFGAKIGRLDGHEPVRKVLLTEPVVGGASHTSHPSLIGGTRHLSAAQFVHDQRNAVALVASQDGRFTIFSWSPCEEVVQAHRIDSLLL